MSTKVGLLAAAAAALPPALSSGKPGRVRICSAFGWPCGKIGKAYQQRQAPIPC
jgi:hypothetical protein